MVVVVVVLMDVAFSSRVSIMGGLMNYSVCTCVCVCVCV